MISEFIETIVTYRLVHFEYYSSRFFNYSQTNNGVDERCLHVALPVRHLPQNVNQTCQYESNYCYPRWMCSAWGRS